MGLSWNHVAKKTYHYEYSDSVRLEQTVMQRNNRSKNAQFLLDPMPTSPYWQRCYRRKM